MVGRPTHVPDNIYGRDLFVKLFDKRALTYAMRSVTRRFVTIRAPHADGQAARAKELRNIRAQEAKLRREKVRLLREELASLRKRVGAVERELRQLGEHEPVSSAGRIRWTDVFEQLDDTFTARQMAELTGAPPSHIGTVAHQWRTKGWITATERGVYRKTGRRPA